VVGAIGVAALVVIEARQNNLIARIGLGGGTFSIVSWIILGLIAGFIAGNVDRQGHSFWLNIALGIAGALVGGFLFDLFGASGVTSLNIYSTIVAIGGAIIVLLIYGAAAHLSKVN
jgi:uncharacterized membrane protein YeaQ/YmgE (transglycosylase-associated protein family)